MPGSLFKKESNPLSAHNSSLARAEQVLEAPYGSGTDILVSTKSITITNFSPSSLVPEDLDKKWLKEQWSLVYDAVSKARRLAQVRCEVTIPVPVALLELLEKKNPHVQLDVLNWSRANRDLLVPDAQELALACSSCLNVIAVKVIERDPDTTKASFSRIIQSAPNLRSIRFTCGRPSPVAMRKAPREPDPWLPHQRPGKAWHTKYRTEQYRSGFLLEKPAIKLVKELKLRYTGSENFPCDPYWSSFIDFFRLATLDIGLSSVELNLPWLAKHNPFKSMKRLSINYRSRLQPEQHLAAFIDSCRLHSLAIFGDRLKIDQPSRFLESQAPMLRFLLLDWMPHPYELIYIRDTCQSLSFLGLQWRDFGRLDDHHNLVLPELISTFPLLQHARISYKWAASMESYDDETQFVYQQFIFAPLQRLISTKVGRPFKTLAVELNVHFNIFSPPSYRQTWAIEVRRTQYDEQRMEIYEGLDLVAFKSASQASFPDFDDPCRMKRHNDFIDGVPVYSSRPRHQCAS